MRRIVILGCSGTGKSTFARRIGARLDLPVVHLDTLFWEPGWVEAETPVFRERVIQALAAGEWVCDGNYMTKTADLRLPQADAIVWIDQPVWLRIWRIAERALMHQGKSRVDLTVGCPERFDRAFLAFLKFTWDFDRVTRPRIQAALDSRFPEKRVTHLRGDREIATYLAGLDLTDQRTTP